MSLELRGPHRTQILVIDDDSALRKLLCRMLALEGYEVVEAHDGYEGLQKYLAVSTGPGDYRYPDACVDDLQMMQLALCTIESH